MIYKIKNRILKTIATMFRRMASAQQQVTYKDFRRRYLIDNSFRFNGHSILFYGDGQIEAGYGSYIGEHSTLQAAPNCIIKIGAHCRISHNVRVYTQSDNADCDLSIHPVRQKTGDVIFEDYCWVGANVFVNPGVRIGTNSVVGANAVVTKDIPSFEIWGGVPARFIRKKKG